jgi:hypothetical protein
MDQVRWERRGDREGRVKTGLFVLQKEDPVW